MTARHRRLKSLFEPRALSWSQVDCAVSGFYRDYIGFYRKEKGNSWDYVGFWGFGVVGLASRGKW